MITRIDHVGIACRDLEASVEFYRNTYGFEVFHSEVNEEQGVREVMLRVSGTDDGGASYLQLLQPTREDSAIARYLAKHGEGLHHIAFGTPDVVAATEMATRTGIRPLYPAPKRGTSDSSINFLHPKDCHGVLTELVQSAAPAPADQHASDTHAHTAGHRH